MDLLTPASPRRRTAPLRRLVAVVVAVASMLGALLLTAPPAFAATSIGTPSLSYSGVTHPPTSDKPQSKLWWNDGSWWATLWKSGTGWRIYRLDRGTETWVDAGTTIDTRSTTLTDTLWDGSHLYVSAQVATVSTETSPVTSKTGQPAKLYRYSYSGGKYTLDSGFPTQINNVSSETLTIDKDTTGRIWASWVQISGSSTSGYTATVYVNASGVGGTSWGTPFVVPGASDPHPSVDDISAVVAFQSKIGVMWSDQLAGKVYFAIHADGASTTSSSAWKVLTARSGSNIADDHMNLKTIQSDSSGRVFAALKTSLDLSSSSGSQPQIVLLVYTPSSGTFTTSTVSTVNDCQTRPQVILDSEHGVVHVVSTGPSTSTSGCPHSGAPGAIYEKTAPLSNPTFASGRGTPIIQDGSSLNINNPTTTKQSVTGTTGLVVLASNDTTKRYWFADESLGGGTVTAPAASFTASPTTGTAPLAVSFTDTSTGTPTSWSWDFGDGSAKVTTQNATHTYAAAGTYTATLTATNAGGSTTATQTVTVSAGSTSAPAASFTASPTSGTAPLAVSFTDTSTGSPTSWSWDFGDGSAKATTQNATHTYSTAGTYTATLTATNTGGSTTAKQTITVGTSSTPAPAASFTASTSSGTAPLTVNFTDTSTGSPTSWSWDFGDGSAKVTTQNASHTYTTTGSYTVTLTATNGSGSSSATKVVQVNAATTSSVTVGQSATSTSASPTSSVTLPKPAGVTNGDVLIAQVNTDGKPSLTSVPAGWTTVVSPLSVGTASTLFVVYHVVTNAAAEPASWSVGLSTAEAWNGGVTDFHGVNTSSPFDTAGVTKVNSTSATTIALSGVTTVTPGALVVGGVGINSTTLTVAPPSGWTEAWEADGGQNVDLASKAMPSAGATGTTPFTLSGTGGSVAWMRALRPA